MVSKILVGRNSVIKAAKPPKLTFTCGDLTVS